MRNEELIRKADLALSDLASDGGLLSDEQTNRFIRTLIDSPTMLNSIRVVTMNSPTKKINKIGFGSRIMQAATFGQAASTRSKPTTSQVTLNSKEVIAEVWLPYEVLEDNIEGGNPFVANDGSPGGLHSTVVQLIAERAALDLEEQLLMGDTSSGDPFLAQNDGLLKLATAHVVDAGAASISKSLMKAGVKAMPDKYLRNRSSLAHFISVDNETEYRDTYASRQTALGDSMLQGTSDIYAYGSPIRAVPLMPATKGLFSDPMNFIFGIQRRVTLEYDKDIRTRTFIIVLTARVDYQIEEADAVVTYTNIGS